MAYRNHIILNGLDEARAHQRGEQIGEKAPKPVSRTYPPRMSKAQKRAIAMTPGTQAEVARLYDVAQTTVRAWRIMLEQGLL